MKKVLENWLAEDVGKGDFTSQAVVENSPCNALVTGGPGIISGIQICKELLIMSNIKFATSFNDGDNIGSETSIFDLEGNSHDILKTERLLLNILYPVAKNTIRTFALSSTTLSYPNIVLHQFSTLKQLVLEKHYNQYPN